MVRARLGGDRRRHGAALGADRRELEATGWRTTLEYRENHVRGRDGRLRQLRVVWHAEAERESSGDDAAPLVVTASATTVERAWSRLRADADLAVMRAGRRARAPGPPAGATAPSPPVRVPDAPVRAVARAPGRRPRALRAAGAERPLGPVGPRPRR